MKLHLKLFLCFMISLEQAAGEDPLLPEDETPGSHQEPNTLIAPEMVHKDKVSADGGSKVSDHAIPTDDKMGKTAKPKVEKKIYVDEKCCNLSTTSHCLKKGGDCIPNNETCYGKEYFGSKYCVISDLKSCKCCVPTDCEEATLESCKLLNGICKGDHEDCDDGDSSVSGADFCKHKTCKCCFPTNCTCGQDYDGGCWGLPQGVIIDGGSTDAYELFFGHCMKTCDPLTTVPLLGHSCSKTGAPHCKCCGSLDCPVDYCVGVHEGINYSGICRSLSGVLYGGDGEVCLSMETLTQMCPGSLCGCCINVTKSCDPPTCNYNGVSGTCSHNDITGMVNVGEQNCKDCMCYVSGGEESCEPSNCNYNGESGICSSSDDIYGMVNVGEQDCKSCKCWIPEIEGSCDPSSCNYNGGVGFCWREEESSGFVNVGKQDCKEKACNCYVLESQVLCDPIECNYNGLYGICSNAWIYGMIEVGEQDCRGCNCWVPKEEVQCDPPNCDYNGFKGICSNHGLFGMVSVGERDCRAGCICWVPKEEVQCEPLQCNYNGLPAICSKDEIPGLVNVGGKDCEFGCFCWVPKEEVKCDDPRECNYYGSTGTCSIDQIDGMWGVGRQDCGVGCYCYVVPKP